ncbi:hypothetical protein [Streptobacillus moniliformis]|uniref:Uncharacterized protein n=1 Tax=Streptobacillus moniliformis (strain ATCC 14647 / DSM 12112 / NCTC 10651 / 9901) TaxID=519441 RepID=D1AYJ8_STRM9|nr:hypothetical protein [Streptobacillus moniliformis]ACZ01374.1 hypothetical protein Smon_0908 [Streptobacillus moniliformis DSM 12112]SQA13466.1 Uncharacterised protein [Streptobacillus moniliformis]SQA14555.1 Uncharacterised protein [Streptobacillus moniliformis]
MAKIKIIITDDEIIEKEKIIELIKKLNKNELLKLKGFLEGLNFSTKVKNSEV